MLILLFEGASYGLSSEKKLLDSAIILCLAQPVYAASYLVKDLGALGGVDAFARAINNAGEIVGIGKYGGETRAFLLTPTAAAAPAPVPLPASLPFVGVALAGLGLLRWRK